MTVFAVHETRDDITPARKFGGVVYINKFYIHGDELEVGRQIATSSVTSFDSNNAPELVTMANDWVIPTGYRLNMERAALSFDPTRDFLLISGDHLQLLAFTAILTARHGTFMVLRYDRQLNDYIPVRLHSGLVPPPGAVLSSGTDIGENDHGESRKFTKE